MATTNEPLLVFGPRSLEYDFGDHHPLTPRRFGPGISLLRAVGAEPALAPAPASDDELAAVHTRRYIDAVRRFSDEPWLPGTMGIGLSDNPAFAGMHDAAASVAGGSLDAMRAILRGEAQHAYHPGGGLHHAMPERAWGFCVYDDPAIAIAAARAAGLRVLYVDLDVHHGDGVQAMFFRDPGVLTVSFHESGRYLFPETGFPDELGEGTAAGTSVNVPFEPFAGEDSWLPAVNAVVPALAASFGPDVVVSQHGADAHAWDPLAHLRVTTTAQWEAAKLVDGVAHRWARGRWLATGGGGYDVYRVVPRTWSLTWLAGAHREPPRETPQSWRDAWAGDAARYGQSPLPPTFLDEPNAGLAVSTAQADADRRSRETVSLVRRVVVPALVREAIDRGWWQPSVRWPGEDGEDEGAAWGSVPADARPTILPHLDAARLERLELASRVLPLARHADARAILDAALLAPGTIASAAVCGTTIVGLAMSVASPPVAAPSAPPADRQLVVLGVAPGRRREGLASALLRAHVDVVRERGLTVAAVVTLAERDAVDPLDRALRARVAAALFARAGLAPARLPDGIAGVDAAAAAVASGALSRVSQ